MLAVDGQPLRVELERGNRIHVELLAGQHAVDVATTDPRTGLVRRAALRFVAEPGHVYRADVSGLSTAPDAAPFAVYEVDAATDYPTRITPSR